MLFYLLPQVAADGSLNPDAAAVIMGTTADDDGHILAMVGGRDFFAGDDDAKFNLASGPGRQAGSSMKPIGAASPPRSSTRKEGFSGYPMVVVLWPAVKVSPHSPPRLP